jgi:alkylation response protein AidB-like acyl-CoA dehydrogenase
LLNHIFKFGTEAQKQKYLAPLAQRTGLGAWSLTEPEVDPTPAALAPPPNATAITG